MNRIDELRETWEKAYKGLVNDLGNQLLLEDVACMFFELGWRAADESMVEKGCDLVNESEDKFKKEMRKWEYKIDKFDGDLWSLEKILNLRGGEGWEFCSQTGWSIYQNLIFKREKKDA